MDEEDLALLSHLEDRAEADDLVHFYCCVLQKIENPLAFKPLLGNEPVSGVPFARLEPQPIHFRYRSGAQTVKGFDEPCI